MGMADDDAETSPGRYSEARVEGLGSSANRRRPLGYHWVVTRITARGLTVQPTC